MSLYLPYILMYNMVMLRTNISQQITKPGNKKNKKNKKTGMQYQLYGGKVSNDGNKFIQSFYDKGGN